MTEPPDLKINLMRAVGAASVGIAIIDNAPGACPVCAKVRAELADRLDGRLQFHQQTCPRGVHRDWWADAPDLKCPWCAVDDLRLRVEQRTAGVS